MLKENLNANKPSLTFRVLVANPKKLLYTVAKSAFAKESIRVWFWSRDRPDTRRTSKTHNCLTHMSSQLQYWKAVRQTPLHSRPGSLHALQHFNRITCSRAIRAGVIELDGEGGAGLRSAADMEAEVVAECLVPP